MRERRAIGASGIAGPLKDSVKTARRTTAHWTRSFRCLPDFLIIGTQKGGTTSLYHYLRKHPQVLGATKKEVHYFNRNFDRGTRWYRGHFPLTAMVGLLSRARGRGITGETTPDYLFNALVPARVQEVLPGCSKIVLLRNPVERAYSHYRHRRRRGGEVRSFDQAIDEELALHARSALPDTPGFFMSGEYAMNSYLSRGLYVDQLQRWFMHHDRDTFLILQSEEFFAEPAAVYGDVLKFLDLDTWRPRTMKKYNFFGESESILPGTRDRLTDFFGPANERLFDLLGRSFDWG